MSLSALLVLLCALMRGGFQEAGEATAPYCGIYCVYAVSSSHDKQIPFLDLCTKRFIRGVDGSTIIQLSDALDVCGIRHECREGLRLSQLIQAGQPSILHVRTLASRVVYRHWVLFLGCDEIGNCRLYDPPRGQVLISAAELLAIWDGIGIVITEPEARHRQWLPLSWLGVMAIACGSCVLLRFMRVSNPWIALPVATILASIIRRSIFCS
jgi:hypothetical protein